MPEGALILISTAVNDNYVTVGDPLGESANVYTSLFPCRSGLYFVLLLLTCQIKFFILMTIKINIYIISGTRPSIVITCIIGSNCP